MCYCQFECRPHVCILLAVNKKTFNEKRMLKSRTKQHICALIWTRKIFTQTIQQLQKKQIMRFLFLSLCFHWSLLFSYIRNGLWKLLLILNDILFGISQYILQNKDENWIFGLSLKKLCSIKYRQTALTFVYFKSEEKMITWWLLSGHHRLKFIYLFFSFIQSIFVTRLVTLTELSNN